MMDHSENTLKAAIKSLRDTVTPAVDPTDAQATEQLRLSIEFLEFLRSRIYDIHARHHRELGGQIAIVEALLAACSPRSEKAEAELREALEPALAVHRDAAAHTTELRAASQRLGGSIRGVLREARQGPAAVREELSAIVVSGLEPLVELDSAWTLPLGLEPDPAAITPLDSLLRQRRVAEPVP